MVQCLSNFRKRSFLLGNLLSLAACGAPSTNTTPAEQHSEKETAVSIRIQELTLKRNKDARYVIRNRDSSFIHTKFMDTAAMLGLDRHHGSFPSAYFAVEWNQWKLGEQSNYRSLDEKIVRGMHRSIYICGDGTMVVWMNGLNGRSQLSLDALLDVANNIRRSDRPVLYIRLFYNLEISSEEKDLVGRLTSKMDKDDYLAIYDLQTGTVLLSLPVGLDDPFQDGDRIYLSDVSVK